MTLTSQQNPVPYVPDYDDLYGPAPDYPETVSVRDGADSSRQYRRRDADGRSYIWNGYADGESAGRRKRSPKVAVSRRGQTQRQKNGAGSSPVPDPYGPAPEEISLPAPAAPSRKRRTPDHYEDNRDAVFPEYSEGFHGRRPPDEADEERKAARGRAALPWIYAGLSTLLVCIFSAVTGNAGSVCGIALLALFLCVSLHCAVPLCSSGAGAGTALTVLARLFASVLAAVTGLWTVNEGIPSLMSGFVSFTVSAAALTAVIAGVLTACLHMLLFAASFRRRAVLPSSQEGGESAS